MAQVQCELTIIKLTNLELDHLPQGKLFIRYYMFAGGGRRIRVDSRKIQSTREPNWDDKSSFECFVASDTMKESIQASNLVFELRWRRSSTTSPIFGMVCKSKLLGRAMVPWKDAVGSNDVSIDRHVSFVMKKKVMEGLKAPMLSVRMSMKVKGLPATEKKRLINNECRCESCGWIRSEEDMFVAATIPASMINSW